MTMARTGLGARFTDHEDAAALLLARSRARYGDATMEADDDTDDDSDDDDDADDEDDADDADDDAGKGDDDADEGKPLGPKGEKALAAERKENRRLKRELRALRNGKPGDKGGKDDDEDEEAREAKAVERARALAKPVLVRSEARTALATAGLIGDPSRLLKMLDLDDIEVVYDSRGEVEDIDGLADQVKELKREYPELFRKRGAGSINAGGGSREKSGPKTASERQAAMLMGR